ncbi:MAG: sensor histidine kinase [Firmicutes bacterium]|nr:sensor histidine kinase [Bacillota bacterium]
MEQTLIVQLFERMSVVATIAFVASRTSLLRRVLHHSAGWQDHLAFIAFFGGLGILGTYTGITVHGALANSRVIGPMVAGLVGGPFYGAVVGLAAGLHRVTLGGFTALACGLSTFCEGVLGGFIQRALRGRTPSGWQALLAGMAGETLQMLIILAVARPWGEAWALVRIIALPMILANGAGIAVFILIIQNTLAEEESIGARQAQTALQIANQTLPYLRNGLTRESAQKAAEAIYGLAHFSAVAITDTQAILAFVGSGSDHHRPGQPHITEATERALELRHIEWAPTRQAIGCAHAGCPLGSAIIVPLLQGERVIGALKLYREQEHAITAIDEQLARGLGHLFATQLALAEVEQQRELTQRARLAALQAQVHPHFLFNALSTISALIRVDPDAARRLLLELSRFLRQSLQNWDRPVSLGQEMQAVEAFVDIQVARFGHRIHFKTSIPDSLWGCQVPPFAIQPLVENAIRHGILEKPGGAPGTVEVSAWVEHAPAGAGHSAGGEAYVAIRVADDGVGMDPDTLRQVLELKRHTGIGLYNVNERLKTLYGPACALRVQSARGQGTSVELRIPLAWMEEAGRPEQQAV